MKKYIYRAKKSLSETVQGTILADSQREAIDKVNELGFIPVEVSEELAIAQAKSHNFQFRFGRKIRPRDLVLLYKQLARLVKSGVPILRSLSIIYEQAENAKLKDVLDQIQKSVREGASLSSALSSFPKVFPAFDISMIQAGESVGKLNEALSKLVAYLEQKEQLRAKLMTSIAYPIFIVVMGFATVFVMITFVIPKFSVFFADLGQELPYATKLLISISDFFKSYALWILCGGALLVPIIKMQMRSKAALTAWHRFVLKIPKVGVLVTKYEVSRLSRALELLLGSGMQLLQAVRIAIPVVQNEVLKQDLELCYKTLEQGGYFSTGLKQSKFFPPFIHHLISVGEEAGKLDEAFREIGDWYEQDTAQSIQIFTNLLEPAIILVVGFVLGLIIIAVLMPIFSISALS